jgi:mono/diheme cytochrome c family protein
VRVHPGSRKVMSWMLGMISLAGIVATAQTKEASPKPYEALIYSVKGSDIYHANCAVCHGAEGKAGGPAAVNLKRKPADLTVLAKYNGGRFTFERVQKFILGDNASVASHGSREMPVWGPIFHQIEEDQDLGNVRLQNLIKYLKTIQQK